MSLPLNDLSGPGGAPSAALADDFGRYRIIRTLAFGGMAQILLAEDPRAQRLIVIKRILPHYATNPEFVQFFIHEGRLGQRLRHPNLVETLEAGQVGDACYIALEYLRGQPAIELLRQAARARIELPLGAAVRIVADAARGLHHAHIAVDNEGKPLGVVHRDVTPHNLFLCSDGRTKVLDFGIAKAASQLHQTRTGTIKGKFAYLAPEQIRGEPIDRRVDVFALGIVLHELLTLRPLFRGANDAETLNRVLTLDVPAPEYVRRGVPPGLGAVALRALQRDRDRRLPSAQALADSIEAVAEAEGIDASQKAVADLLAELCPADEASQREYAASISSEKLNAPITGSNPAMDRGASEQIPTLSSPPTLNSGPTVSSAPMIFPGMSMDSGPTLGALAGGPSMEPPTDPAPPPEVIIELRHPKAVPALHLADADLGRDGHRKLAARAALLVGGVAIMALLANQIGSCVARLGHPRAATAPSPRSELAAPVAPPVKAMTPLPTPQAPPVTRLPVAPPLGLPSPTDTELVPAGVSPGEALLRVQVEGPATYVIDGRTERAGADGALHLSPGHHRVTVSSPSLAFPRTLEVDLRAREFATRAIPRGRGQLRVAVTPWAEVTIDGRVLGVTPLAPVDLVEGTHQVALRNAELGVTSKRRVVVSPNKETLLKLDLFGEKK
ncbi:MAG: serine/threonine protein kinase [Myxococcales bacterium]|nr:serine/threonine protein kinase [Myxococcales bacterium]